MRAGVILMMLLAGIWEDAGERGGAAAKGQGQGQGERQLREAVAAAPGDFEARRALAELLAANKRKVEAAREFERAARLAPTPADEARMWFRVAGERTRAGTYDQALDAYERQLALGDTDPAALANSAELLMARGRTGEAIDRYREAVAIEEREPNRREHIRGVALGYFGLAVALDRAGHAIAAREAIARALALDPGLAVLRLAGQPDSEVFFVPSGEVYYYLALAREAQGRGDDAATAFKDYLRFSTGPHAGRAREHLARLLGDGATADSARASGSARGSAAAAARAKGGPRAAGSDPTTAGRDWRVLHEATVFTAGPLVAPLIDAAWRLHPRLLDPCLAQIPQPAGEVESEAASSRQIRVSMELRIDESGRVGAASIKAPVGGGEGLPACIESALRNQFRVSRPAKHGPTLVRMELVLAPAPPGGV